MADVTAQTTGAPAPAKKTRTKKLVRTFDGTKVVFTEGTTKTVKTYDFNALPKEIKDKLGPFGLASKVGDAAAGKAGKDAIDAMDKVWEGLMKGDWSVRVPAQEKITVSTLKDRFEAIPAGADRDAMAAGLKKLFKDSPEMLAKLGIK